MRRCSCRSTSPTRRPGRRRSPTTVETFGGLHGLLNAAGVGVRNSIEDCTPRGISPGQRHQLDGHVPRLQDRDPGDEASRAAARSSTSPRCSACAAPSYAMAYCASKGAVRSLTKNVALHCAQMKYNIRCNSVHPGYIDTPMIAPRLAGNDRQHDRPAVARGAASARPPRPGRRGRQHDPLPAVGRIRPSRPARSSSATAG